MTVEIAFLKSIPYFKSLDSSVLESISPLVKEKKVGRGEIILYEDEPAETLFSVVSGAVKIFKTSADGKEQILNIVRPGESFNDAPVLDEGNNMASAQAMSTVVLYELKRTDFKALLKDQPQIALNTIRVLAEQVRRLVLLVEDLSFRHVIGRVARILLENIGDEGSLEQRLTQQEMAAMAGTVREVVGRSLKALEDEGVIRMDRHRIIIVDKEALKGTVDSYF